MVDFQNLKRTSYGLERLELIYSVIIVHDEKRSVFLKEHLVYFEVDGKVLQTMVSYLTFLGI